MKTALQSNFNAIDIALVDGVPRTLTLREMLQYYIDHRIDVVTRRTQFDLDKALKDVHIKEGLLIAVDNIDEIVHIIRSSETEAEAKRRMNSAGTDDPQSTPFSPCLRKLTGLAREQLAAEIESSTSSSTTTATFSPTARRSWASSGRAGQIIGSACRQAPYQHLLPRRHRTSTSRTLSPRRTWWSPSPLGHIKRLPVATHHRSQRRGGKGVQTSRSRTTTVEDLFVASTHDYVMFFTNFGRVYRLKVHELPIGSRQCAARRL